MAATNDLFLEIVGQFTDKISPELQNLAGKAIPELMGALAGLAVAFGIGKMSEFIQASIDAGDELGKLSQRTGVAVEDLSALSLAAKLGDVSTQEMASAVNKLNKAMNESKDASSKYAYAFDQLGIKTKDANGNLRSNFDVMADLAEVYAKSKDGPEKVASAMELMGRGGVKMITVLNGGKEALLEFKKTAEDLGLVWSPEQTAQAEKFNDSFTLLQSAMNGLWDIIAKRLLPILAPMAEYFASSAKEGGILRGILDGIAEVISGSVGAALQFLGTAFSTIMVTAHAAGIAIGGLAAAIVQLGSLDFKAVDQTLTSVREDLKKLYEDYATFNDQIWNPEKYAGKKSAAEETINAGGAAAKKLADEFAKAEQGLLKELTVLNQTGKTAEVIYQTQKGAWKDFNDAQKARLIGIAREIDLQKQLLDITKQSQALEAARNAKVSTAEIASYASQIANLKERAGYEAAANQLIQEQIFLTAQRADAEKNADPITRKARLDKLDAEEKLYQQGGAMYEQARKMGEMEYELTAATKIYNDALGNQQKQMTELLASQEGYNKLLAEGKLGQAEYAVLTRTTARAIEDLRNSTTDAGKSLLDINNNRRGMEDLSIKMSNITDAFKAGKISSAEYTESMYTLQARFDSINPVFAINQVEKMKDAVKSAIASFEGLASNALFDIMQGKWEGFADNFKKIIDRMVANMLAAQLQMALFGDIGSTPAGKTPASQGLIGGAFSAIFAGYRESGGPVQAGQAYVVGEKRPELFIPDSNGTIAPSVGSSNNTYITALDTQSFAEYMSRNSRTLANITTAAQRQYGLKGGL